MDAEEITFFVKAANQAAVACPKDWSGFFECPQEWQTVYGVGGAILTALIAFGGAWYTARSAEKRESQKQEREVRALAMALGADFYSVNLKMESGLNYAITVIDMTKKIPFDVRYWFEIFSFDQSALEKNLEKIGFLNTALCIDVCDARRIIGDNYHRLSDAVNAMRERRGDETSLDEQDYTDLGVCIKWLREAQQAAAHISRQLILFAEFDDIAAFEPEKRTEGPRHSDAIMKG